MTQPVSFSGYITAGWLVLGIKKALTKLAFDCDVVISIFVTNCYPSRVDKNSLFYKPAGFYAVEKTSHGWVILENGNEIDDDYIFGKVYFQCEETAYIQDAGQYRRCELEKNHKNDHLVHTIHRWENEAELSTPAQK